MRIGLTQAEYARHRGVSAPAVSRYKRCGYLVLFADGSIDATASDRRLAGILDPTLRRDKRGAEVRLSLADVMRLYGAR